MNQNNVNSKKNNLFMIVNYWVQQKLKLLLFINVIFFVLLNSLINITKRYLSSEQSQDTWHKHYNNLKSMQSQTKTQSIQLSDCRNNNCECKSECQNKCLNKTFEQKLSLNQNHRQANKQQIGKDNVYPQEKVINHKQGGQQEISKQDQQAEEQSPGGDRQKSDEEQISDLEGGANSKWKVIEQPQKAVKLFMIDFGHCDAKKCSGKKLQRFKLLTSLDKKKKFRGLVLSAFGKKQVSYEDLQCAQKHGVCVVDCSWNRIQQTRQFRFKHQRKLPFVIAGNPINYGKPYQLSCAEALATALCTIAYNDQAQYLMSKFGWADGFWTLNHSIQNYAKCKTLDQLKKQSKIIEQSGSQTFQRNYDLSDSQEQDN